MKFGMYNGMQYDPIQGQGKVMSPSKVSNPAVFIKLFSQPFITGAGN